MRQAESVSDTHRTHTNASDITYMVRTDTVRDSIYRDVLRHVYTSGDTVYSERVEYAYRDRWRLMTDTVMVHDTVTVCDTTAASRMVTTTVTTSLTAWQGIRLATWPWLVAVTITGILALYIKLGK